MMFESEVILPDKHVKSSDSLYHIENAQKEFHHSKLGVHAFNLWVKDKYTDVTVKINDKSYKAHRPVLSCYSSYFKKHILSTNLKIIQIDELSITPKSFEILLNFMYTGCIDLTVQNIGDVYMASKKLGIKKTLNLCEEILTGKVSRKVQCVYLYVTAKKLNEKDGAERALKIMAHYFEYIVTTREFLDLNFNELTEYLSRDYLAVRSEIIVYLAALKWLNHDFLEREIYINQVLQCVRFPLMALNEILACFTPPLLSGIVEIPEVEYMLLKATCYIASKTVDEFERLQKYSCKPRDNLVQKVPLMLWDPNIFCPTRYSHYQKEKAAITIQSEFRKHVAHREKQKLQYLCDITVAPYHTIGDETKKIKKKALPTTETFPSDIPNPARKYSSGIISVTELQKCEIPDIDALEITKDNITDVKPTIPVQKVMSDRDKELEVSKLEEGDNRILIMGGVDRNNIEDNSIGMQIINYNSNKDVWYKFGNMPVRRHNMCAVYHNSCIYIIGGSDVAHTLSTGEKASNDCRKFQLKQNVWITISSMLTARIYHGAAAIHDVIFAVGGVDGNGVVLDSIERYDINKNEWQLLKFKLKSPKMGIGVCAYKDNLWMAGGMNDSNKKEELIFFANVEVFNSETDVMQYNMSDLPSPRSCVSLVECNNLIYCIGGLAYEKYNTLVSLQDVFVYENDMAIWVYKTPLLNPGHSISTVALGDAIYAINGLSTSLGSAASKAVSVYDSKNRTWTSCNPLPDPYEGISVLCI